MRRLLGALGVLGLCAGVASANSYNTTQRYDRSTHALQNTPGTYERVVSQQRGIFNSVRVKKDLTALCDGQEPVDVQVFHTVGDGMAAVFTGILWTPAHLRVTCPAPTALGQR